MSTLSKPTFNNPIEFSSAYTANLIRSNLDLTTTSSCNGRTTKLFAERDLQDIYIDAFNSLQAIFGRYQSELNDLHSNHKLMLFCQELAGKNIHLSERCLCCQSKNQFTGLTDIYFQSSKIRVMDTMLYFIHSVLSDSPLREENALLYAYELPSNEEFDDLIVETLQRFYPNRACNVEFNLRRN